MCVMAHPQCQYYYNNELKQEGTVPEILQTHIQPLIKSNKLLQIKGNGSRVANINWEMFLGKAPKEINRENLNKFGPFNHQVLKWFQLNMSPIKSDHVVIQYDGDKIVAEDLENSDTIFQNYTGILYGLVYYLSYLNKKIDLVVMLDKPEDKWSKNLHYHWAVSYTHLRAHET